MSNDKNLARLWKLQTSINKMIADGARDLEMVIDVLQGVVDQPAEMQITINQTLTEMVAAGNYSWVNDNITNENFPHQGEGVVTLKPVLVHLDSQSSTDNVMAELKRRKLRPGNAAELLAFGSTYPEIQRKFPIVALGQSARVDGNPSVPYLYGDGSARGLSLDWFGDGWGGSYRFLAFEL